MPSWGEGGAPKAAASAPPTAEDPQVAPKPSWTGVQETGPQEQPAPLVLAPTVQVGGAVEEASLEERAPEPVKPVNAEPAKELFAPEPEMGKETIKMDPLKEDLVSKVSTAREERAPEPLVKEAKAPEKGSPPAKAKAPEKGSPPAKAKAPEKGSPPAKAERVKGASEPSKGTEEPVKKFRETLWFMKAVNPEDLEDVKPDDAEYATEVHFDRAKQVGDISEEERRRFSLDANGMPSDEGERRSVLLGSEARKRDEKTSDSKHGRDAKGKGKDARAPSETGNKGKKKKKKGLFPFF